MALDTVFLALSDPTRRGMLVALRHGEMSVSELARPHRMSLAGASKHIGVLERAGLVVRRKEGRRYLCRLRAAPLREADAWLRGWEQFWKTRLDALETLIGDEGERR